jgi:trans-aconitate methyltransferase
LLPWLADAKRVLTVGEGDGRFVAELARRFPEIKVDCVEASGAMIARARAFAGECQSEFSPSGCIGAGFSQGRI